MTLGSYPALSVEAARRKALALRAETDAGENPADRRKAERALPTFGELTREYLDVHSKVHKSSWRNDERMFQRHFKSWFTRRLDDVTQWSLQKHLREIGEQSGPYEANRVHSCVRHMLNMAIRWGWLPGPNPAAGIPRFKEQARERFLSRDEARRVFAAIANEPSPWWRAFFMLSIFLGTRCSELLSARWDDVDLEARTIRLPKTKAGRSHTLPLVDGVVDVLRELPRIDGNPHLFPGRAKCGHLVEPAFAWDRIRGRAAVSDVRIHDLRRTLGSWLAASGYGLPLIGKVLNHSQPSVTAIYSRLDLEPQRVALQDVTAQFLEVATDLPREELERAAHDEVATC